MKKSLKRLVIDSATPYLYIAIYDGNNELDAYYQEGHNDHSVKLMSELEIMLDKHHITIKDLDQIIIGIGPGSYTGLRVGVVVAKMFGWTLGIDVFSVSSLALLASSADNGKVIPAVDARRGNAFLGLYHVEDNDMTLIDEEQLVNIMEFQEKSEGAEMIFQGKPKMTRIFESIFMKKINDIHQLNPNYLRLTEAEKNANK